jgi:hypothetical protein
MKNYSKLRNSLIDLLNEVDLLEDGKCHNDSDIFKELIGGGSNHIERLEYAARIIGILRDKLSSYGVDSA